MLNKLISEKTAQHKKEAEIFMKQKDYNKAQSAYEEIIRIDKEALTPEIVSAYTMLGQIYYSKGDQLTALNMYKKAIELDKNRYLSPTFIALCYGGQILLKNATEESSLSLGFNQIDFEEGEGSLQNSNIFGITMTWDKNIKQSTLSLLEEANKYFRSFVEFSKKNDNWKNVFTDSELNILQNEQKKLNIIIKDIKSIIKQRQ